MINLVAHRGFRKPGGLENRMIDFKKALETCKAVEFDIRMTKDKKIIIFHDHNFKRIGNLNKSVRSLTYKEIKDIDFFKRKKDFLPALFIEDFINKIANQYNFINVEIKPDRYTRKEFAIIRDSLDLLRAQTRAEIVVSSFGKECQIFISNLDPIFKKGYLVESFKNIDYKLIKKFDYLHPYIGTLKRKGSFEIVEKVNLPLNIWTFKNDKDALKIYEKYYKYIKSYISDKEDLKHSFK